jgi:alpha/beta superfamily hydrolase
MARLTDFHRQQLAKSSLESIWKFSFGSILVVLIFSMHARRPIRPHMAIKPKIEVSAGGKAVIRLSL